MTEQKYPILKGRGGRDHINGATCDGDKYMHLGELFSRQTACNKPFKDFLITCSDVEITCPDCIKAIRKKG